MEIRGDRQYRDAPARASSAACLRVQVVRMACCYARCPGRGQEDIAAAAWDKLLASLPELDLAVGAPGQWLIQRARWNLLVAVERATARACGPESSDDAGRECPEMLAAVQSYGLSLFLSGLCSRERLVLALALGGLTAEQIGTVAGRRAEWVDVVLDSVTGLYREWLHSSAPGARQSTRRSRARRLARRAPRSKEDSETRTHTASLKGGG